MRREHKRKEIEIRDQHIELNAKYYQVKEEKEALELEVEQMKKDNLKR